MAGKRATISIDLIADASKAKAGLKQAEDAAGSLQNQFKNVAKTAGAAFATREIVNFAKGSISAASDLAESMNAVQVTFGDASEEILKLGENASKTVGMSARDFNAFAVQFAGFTKQIAGANGDVTAVTDELTVRIADFASVMNLDIPRAAQIFQSSLSGSSEPARAFGIDMSDAAVKAHALATGLVDSTAEMTEAEKVTSRYSLLMESTSQMAGDFSNTQDGLANSMRILEADMDNARATIGEAMVPALQAVTGAVVPVLDAFTSLPEGLQQTIAMAGMATLGFKSASTTLQGFGVSARTANTALGGLGLALYAGITIYNMYATAKADAIAKTQELKTALEAEAAGQEAATEKALAAAFTQDELGEAVADLGLKASDFVDFVTGKQVPAIQALMDATDKYGGSAEGFKALQRDLGIELEGNAADLEIVRSGVEDWTAALETATTEQERTTGAMDELGIATEDTNAELDEALRIISESAKPTREMSEAVDELWKSTDELYRGMFALNPEFQKYLDTLDNEAAVRDLESAVSDYDALLQTNTASEDELAEAKQRVAEQTRNVIEELGNVPAETQADLLIMVQDDQLEELIERTNRLKDALNAVSGDISSQMFNVEALRGTVEGFGALGQRNIYAETMASARPTRAMAAGGIVTGPTVARLGEYGPEAVIPLTGGNARGGLGATYNIVVNAGVGDPGSIGQKVVETIKAYERRNGNSWRQ